jgi:hypothetical protein
MGAKIRLGTGRGEGEGGAFLLRLPDDSCETPAGVNVLDQIRLDNHLTSYRRNQRQEAPNGS